jgi:diguanylate cyclase (GGDEF)-like protein
MSLIRQIRLLLLVVVLLAVTGSMAVHLVSARESLQTQIRVKNSDNAHALALALSQQAGDQRLMELAMAAQFDTGFYRSIRLVRTDGTVAFERHADTSPMEAPAWFITVMPIASEPGLAQVSDGWRALGRVEVVSHTSYAHDELWSAVLQDAGWMVLVAVGAVLLGGAVVHRIRRPLDAAVAQAQALVEGRYVSIEESRVPELSRLTTAMNAMVQRVRVLFESQATQVETLRRQAHADPLTGVAHRAYFMERLAALAGREDGAEGGAVVLVRLADVAGLNMSLGRETTDRALMAIARALLAYPERAPDCFVGRLNGSDFALCLPYADMASETAASIANGLRLSLPAIGPTVHVHLGAVSMPRDATIGAAMSQADLALARAESRGPFAVEVVSETAPGGAGRGERAWRTHILAAVAEGRTRLVEYPVIDRQGALSHLECPLRMQLDLGGAYDAAARWLPLAVRSRLTAQVDSHAVRLVLSAIDADGQPRGVNIATASLADAAFAGHLRLMLQETPRLARCLWLEFNESAALERFDVVQEFGRLLRPLGVRIGLEHAGERLVQIERLYELGLDYVKLDAALCAGVCGNGAVRDFVKTTAALLHALSMQVQAEGVRDGADVEALWACGVDAVTGPWASAAFKPPVQ